MIARLFREQLECDLTRYAVSRLVPADGGYAADLEPALALVEAALATADGAIAIPQLALVDLRSRQRFLSVVEGRTRPHILFDRGFIDLLCDNLALQYLMDETAYLMPILLADDREGRTSALRGICPFPGPSGDVRISGTQLTRSIACKVADAFFACPEQKKQFDIRFHWTTEDGLDPGATLVDYLMSAPQSVSDYVDALAMDFPGDVSDTVAFVTLHEVAHTIFPGHRAARWPATGEYADVSRRVSELYWLRVPTLDDARFADIRQVLHRAQLTPEEQDRAIREAFFDIRALSILIAATPIDGGRDGVADRLARLYRLVAVTNSFLILRRHLEHAFRSRNLQRLEIRHAQGEALVRNLFVLGWLIELAEKHLGAGVGGAAMIARVHPEHFIFDQRCVFFPIDLEAAIGECEEWASFIGSIKT